VTQQIQSKLGNFSNVRELLEEPKRLIGLDAASAPPDPKKAAHRYKEPLRPPPPPAAAAPKANGGAKPFAFSRPASKNLAKLDGAPVSTKSNKLRLVLKTRPR